MRPRRSWSATMLAPCVVSPTTSGSSTRGRCATSATRRRSRSRTTNSSTSSSTPRQRARWGWIDQEGDRKLSMSKSAIAGIGVAAVLVGGSGLALVSPRALGARYHEFQITFPTADGLVSGSDVLEAGSKIGTISAITPTQDNSALVTVQISADHWPLHNGTTADIRPKSLLGEKYVDIHDGTATNTALDTSVVLHETQKAVPVELDQFINSLDEPTRNAARVLLNDLGAGVAGRGQSLNQAIASGKSNLANLAVFGTTLNNRDPDLDRILVGLDGVLSKLTTSDQLTQMSQLITNGQQTLNAIESVQTSFSRGFTDANVALADLHTAIDA